MKKFTSLLLSFVLVFSVLGSTLQSYAAESNYEYLTIKVKFNQTEARKMLDLVNEFRASDETWFWRDYKKVYAEDLFKYDKEHVSSPLVYDYRLEKYAMQRAAEIATSDIEHERPNGTYCFDVVDEENRNGGRSFDGENASGVPTKWGYGAKEVFLMFKEDISKPTSGEYGEQGHRINMMFPHRTFACACCEYKGVTYWIQAFGTEPFEDAFVETEAVNTTKQMTVEFLCDITYSFRQKDEDISSLAVYEKASIAIPSLYVNKTYGNIINKRKKLNSNLTASNKNAFIKSGKIVGKTAGTTVFTASGGDLPDGKTVKFKVTIKHKYKLIKHIKSTVKKEGKKIYKCECCGHKKTEKLPKLTKTPTNIKVKGGKKCYVLTWKKVKGAAGYEIKHREVGNPQKGCNGGCSGDKTRYKETYCLESGKTYNVQIQAYRIVNGKKVFSKWSKKYKVKIK